MAQTTTDEEGPSAPAPGAKSGRSAGRLDALSKATGKSLYVGDLSRPGMAHAAVVRSAMAHARIRGIDTSAAAASPGVIGIYTAADVSPLPYGRYIRDVPILARDKVRYVGEPVAAVVAETRLQAERAAALVEVDYEELPRVTTPEEAFAPGAPLVHDAPWEYPGAPVKPEDGNNLQSLVRVGDFVAVEEALASSAHVVEQTYTSPAGHQGYIEPWACLAEIEPSGKVHVWLTNKSPFLLRNQIGVCLGIDKESIEIEPITLGGDFGGKGSPEHAPLCIELARLTGRPVKFVLRYSEDLIATNPRHPSRITVRVGCDSSGQLTALALKVALNGGAYVGFKPAPNGSIHGTLEAPGYRLPAFFAEARIAYTNTVPKGHMRAPGGPQATFAFESALDELAMAVGLDPIELRARNLLDDGDTDANGHSWMEYRGKETLAAAVAAFIPREAPLGWLSGRGVSVYNRASLTSVSSSLCLVPIAGGKLRVEVPMVETGTGSHTLVRELLARELGFSNEDIEIVQVSTDDLPDDEWGAGASRVSATMSMVVDEAVKGWRSRLTEDEPVRVFIKQSVGEPVGSYAIQIAQVAIDPETGQMKVLEILNAVDVAEVINEKAHQMQIDGGMAMGYGFACLEDLIESDGQVWAANLGEFKLPSARDVPPYKTVLVSGARGMGTANVKPIGELTTPPTAGAIANAIADATGCRVRDLPLSAERIYLALKERGSD